MFRRFPRFWLLTINSVRDRLRLLAQPVADRYVAERLLKLNWKLFVGPVSPGHQGWLWWFRDRFSRSPPCLSCLAKSVSGS